MSVSDLDKHWEVLKSTGNEPKLLNERNSSPLMYSPCHIVLRYKSLQSELTLKSSYTIYIVAKISMVTSCSAIDAVSSKLGIFGISSLCQKSKLSYAILDTRIFLKKSQFLI